MEAKGNDIIRITKTDLEERFLRQATMSFEQGQQAMLKKVVEMATKSGVLCSEEVANQNNCYHCRKFYDEIRTSRGKR